MKQVMKVISSECDGDFDPNTNRIIEWKISYILYETTSNEKVQYNSIYNFEIYDDDGMGNGNFICAGYSISKMINLMRKLGKFVEWEEGVPKYETPPALPECP